MGVFSSQGTERQRGTRRTIWSTFAAMVAVPVACLVVLWGLVLGLVIGGAMGGPDTPHHDHEVVVDFVVVIGIGLVIIIVGVTMMGLFARRLARDVTGLEATARHLADEEMPALIERLRQGEQEAIPAEAAPQLRTKTAEIARAEAAITSLQHTAAVAAAPVRPACATASRQVFVSLARRNQSLLQRQLRLIDALEQKAVRPGDAGRPVRAGPPHHPDAPPRRGPDHPVRRGARAVLERAGARSSTSSGPPWPRSRTTSGSRCSPRPRTRWPASAVADMIHLLAELIENATLFSPSGTRVEVRAERVANGFAIEVEDRGPGHRGRPAAPDQPAAGQPARLRPGQRRPARPVRGGQAGRPARRPGRAAAVSLRRHHGGRADARQHRGAGERDRRGHRPRPPPAGPTGCPAWIWTTPTRSR